LRNKCFFFWVFLFIFLFFIKEIFYKIKKIMGSLGFLGGGGGGGRK